jgi:ATP sulfurylase
MGLMVKLNVVVYCDNQSTISISNNGFTSEKTKHVDIKYKYIKECIDQGIISTEWISTNDQQADILTKQLTTTKFTQFRNLLMIE